MKKQKKDEKDWTKHLQNHRQNCELAWEDFKILLEEHERRRNIKLLLRRFKEKIQQLRCDAVRLHETLIVEPAQKTLSLERANLTEQQYYLLRAAGITMPTAKSLGISPVDDHEVYRHCIYKDDKQVCFLDPNENPVVETVDKKTGCTKVRIRLAISPEEIELKHLRPEQREFFAKYRPDVLERIQKD